MKTLLFANTDWYLYNFRLNLVEAIRGRGHEVVLVSPPGPYGPRLVEAGYRWLPLALDRKGSNPLDETRSLMAIARLYRAERPDLVHHFTIKCVLYGSLAARLAGIPAVINSVTGLGHVFLNQSGKGRWMRRLVIPMYRLALSRSQIIFQNRDDLDFFSNLGLLSDRQAHVIRGSGVEIAQFMPVREPGGIPLVILPGRMLKEKGIDEFVAAARMIKSKGIEARFALVGDCDAGNPSSYREEQLRDWERENVIEWWGWQENMPKVYAQSNLICLPSYREGVPRTLIEAAASQRAIIATDVPGCREIVAHGINGLLTPPGNIEALASALETLISCTEQRTAMGVQGRIIVEKEFSSQIVIEQTLGVYSEVVQDI